MSRAEPAAVAVNTRLPENNRYVLLRSFEERERHLQELEAFMETMPLASRATFLPDSMSGEIPSYYANMPEVVQKWIWRRHEVVNISRFRHSSGLDQPQEPLSDGPGYAPNRYTVRCRNEEELDRHLGELEAYCRAKGENYDAFNCLSWFKTNGAYYLPNFTPDSFLYVATLRPRVLEWVNSRNEVITIEPIPDPRAGDARLKNHRRGRWRAVGGFGKWNVASSRNNGQNLTVRPMHYEFSPPSFGVETMCTKAD
ncbi:hypothetical protein C8F04DRAFT_1229250 [Mycena alexandri]|uniref:Uncharacterized protein n=1 Tax=Mycena alexandri TaxID=1745969 RepID=A0AAD6XDA2_9AGAR|nr:hypothetical protein C8F04DRAFT_1229250 [Mycena alexandri]